MNQIRGNPHQEIEIEENLPSELIFHKDTKDPEKNGVAEKMPKIGMKEHGGYQLPGILIPRDRMEIPPDPVLNLNITPGKGKKYEPIYP
jgi:hypothetical protein